MALGTVKKYYPDLARGYNPVLPPRAMDPDGNPPFLYVDSLNYIAVDGRLQRRPVFVTGDASLQPGSPLGIANETVLWCGFFDISDIDFTTVLVTSSQLWVKPNTVAAWVNCTPTYSTGTITATNGSGAITGAGTLWLTSNIGKFSTITIAGTVYVVTSVNSDNSITISPNFSGATGAGKAYVITRLFGNNSSSPYFVTAFNFNLYVAGNYCGGPGPDGLNNRPAVIKVSNFSSSPSSSYITAGVPLAPGLDFIALTRVAGLAALQDGRIVVAGSQNYSFYSSHLSDVVWTASPGGNTPITLIPGKVSALGSISNNLTFHHSGGIVWGYPTGQADPPLRFQASAASDGCFAPRTLKTIGGSEYFLTVSGSVKRFDGGPTIDVGDPVRPSLRALNKLVLELMYAAIDTDRGDYVLVNASGGAPTTFWHYKVSLGQWFPCEVPATVGSLSDGVPATDYDPRSRFLAGLKSTTAGTDLTGFYKETTDRDTITLIGSSRGTYFVTDDTDFGDPLAKKSIQRIILWADHATGTAESVNMQISRDQGLNWTAVTGSMLSTSLKEAAFQFCFDELTPGAATQWRFKFGPADTNVTTLRPLRMLVVANDTGAVDLTDL